MRSTIVYGINDHIRIDLGCDVSIIGEVIAADKCRCIDGIIYKVAKEEKAKINKENLHEITSYDD